MAILEEPYRFLREELGNQFTPKEKSLGTLEQCLENKVSQVTLENSVKFWSFISSKYAQDASKNAEEYLLSNLGLLLKAKSIWPSNYHSEADVTYELTLTKESHYQSLIRFLR